MGYNFSVHIFSTLTAVFWTVFIIYWFLSALGSKRNVRSGAGWVYNIGFRAVTIFAVILILRNPATRQYVKDFQSISLNPVLGFVGILLMVLGMGWAVWARVYLGKNWGMPMTLRKD